MNNSPENLSEAERRESLEALRLENIQKKWEISVDRFKHGFLWIFCGVILGFAIKIVFDWVF